jgi:hypothetical protein
MLNILSVSIEDFSISSGAPVKLVRFFPMAKMTSKGQVTVPAPIRVTEFSGIGIVSPYFLVPVTNFLLYNPIAL